MNLDGDASTDEYFVTAIQIFDYCGADSNGTLRVDDLMDKLSPFVKTNKAEFGNKIDELKFLLDPEECNPDISVNKLAMILNKYSDSQRIKVDLEESFNLKAEQVPHDSDSGISTDGLLEELQCEVRERRHQALRLRAQLDLADSQHDEALAALAAERDSLRAHLNMLREENASLSRVRREREEAGERLGAAERALDEARRELDTTRRRARALHDQLTAVEDEKSSLEEKLCRSKEEYHRMNERYAARQAALRQENEALRGERAELAARLRDRDDLAASLLNDKVLLEMELKDVLNKSMGPRRAERSADVSYTEEQMLSELDSLNTDSRFVQEHHLLDEESFINALQDDQGRFTNASLFQELRFSIGNMSRSNIERTTAVPVGTQTDLCDVDNKVNDDELKSMDAACVKCHEERTSTSCGSQTDAIDQTEPDDSKNKDEIPKANESRGTQYDHFNQVHTASTQTDESDEDFTNNNSVYDCMDCSKCMECEKLRIYTSKLEGDVGHCHETMSNMQLELTMYEDNLNVLKNFLDEGNSRNKLLEEFVEGLKSKLVVLENAYELQNNRNLSSVRRETDSVSVQTEYEISSVSTQTEMPCKDCVSRKNSRRSLKKYLWEPLKWALQLLAVLCFALALCALYAVGGARAGRGPCRERAVPWRWLRAQDLLDLLLRVEYVADVPM